ncbi:hypothetical protein [Nonomuraea jiangxiensis]|uniref:Uncharacterized protein n=1 Tax=Nonomuraea jiangxiensis TaxID=633440 RepID=A0A1G8XW31_9ACTN|nr:hypothetical protein [Nonomuraea jiangxiensis]SDJ94105.1 hypothetical protein SAMN05421869_11377 [Nonomuraea jiangxiensis]
MKEPPETQNDPGGVATPTGVGYDQQAAQDLVRVPRQRQPRHVTGQTSLPIVPALAFPPQPGQKQAVLIVEECPACDWWHRHNATWPAGAMLDRRGRCGTAYTLVPYVRRRRKKAAK